MKSVKQSRANFKKKVIIEKGLYFTLSDKKYIKYNEKKTAKNFNDIDI